MKRIPRTGSFLVLGCLLGLILLAAAIPIQSQNNATISHIVFPAVNLEGIGNSTTLYATIDCAAPQGCSAFSVRLDFDPDVIEVDTVALGPYLGADILVIENKIDNLFGTISLTATVSGAMPNPNSSVLFSVEITALEEGSTMIAFTHVDVADAMGYPLEAQGVDAKITIERPKPISTPTEVRAAATVAPCFVTPKSTGYVDIRVGPGENRGLRSSLNAREEVLVVGQATDDDGNLWWKIQPEGYNKNEADRYWVAADDVREIGDCDLVANAEASPLIAGPTVAVGGGGGGGDGSPHITSVTISGNCDSFRYTVSWNDPDGNAVRIEKLSHSYEVLWSKAVSGSGGNTVWTGHYCTYSNCWDYFRITDADGKSSTMTGPTIYCN
jgi:hypothetical protein